MQTEQVTSVDQDLIIAGLNDLIEIQARRIRKLTDVANLMARALDTAEAHLDESEPDFALARQEIVAAIREAKEAGVRG